MSSTPNPSSVSAAQLAANRANAQQSTGPRTPEGKERASLNAVKTGLTGRFVYLTAEDAPKYQALRDGYFYELRPVGVLEAALVQSLVDGRWRLESIPLLEAGIVSDGVVRAATDFPDLEAQHLSALEPAIRAQNAALLRNLQLQESRLARRYDKDMAELRKLQAARKAKEAAEEAEAMERAAEARVVAEHRKQPFSLEENGFEFSKRAFDAYFARLTPAQKQALLERGLQNSPQTAKTAAA